MLDRFLEGVNYYDFPSFEVAIFSLILAFILSSMIAVTYQITYRGKHFPNNFFQAMILSSIVISVVMMAVGNNLAVGIGLIGAIAIIRSPTLISDPRNIIFMFAGISIGITTGVYGYAMSIGGMLIFCFVAIVLRISPYGMITYQAFEVIHTFDEDLYTEKSFFHHLQQFEGIRDIRMERKKVNSSL